MLKERPSDPLGKSCLSINAGYVMEKNISDNCLFKYLGLGIYD